MEALHEDSKREIYRNVEQHYEFPCDPDEGDGEEYGDLG